MDPFIETLTEVEVPGLKPESGWFAGGGIGPNSARQL
jgi:hypothetical protein